MAAAPGLTRKRPLEHDALDALLSMHDVAPAPAPTLRTPSPPLTPSTASAMAGMGHSVAYAPSALSNSFLSSNPLLGTPIMGQRTIESLLEEQSAQLRRNLTQQHSMLQARQAVKQDMMNAYAQISRYVRLGARGGGWREGKEADEWEQSPDHWAFSCGVLA